MKPKIKTIAKIEAKPGIKIMVDGGVVIKVGCLCVDGQSPLLLPPTNTIRRCGQDQANLQHPHQQTRPEDSVHQEMKVGMSGAVCCILNSPSHARILILALRSF